ncbi:MAG: GNAT family N-acetyltransferase, partial [Chloroflexi bacterium]|nr:GNAT family N-acetyltransferase [Chloroflexota bacterium]
PVGGPINLTEEGARDWFVRMIDPGRPTDFYCLIFNEEFQPIGEISFHRLDQESMTAEFNIKVAGAVRRKGYAREAMSIFLDYFFNQFGGHVLLDDVALDNQAGQRALLLFGFEHDSSVKDVFRLRMTRERFNALHGSNTTTGDGN